MLKNTFAFWNEEEIVMYIQMHQAILVRFLDILDEYKKQVSKQSKLDSFYVTINNTNSLNKFRIISLLVYGIKQAINNYRKAVGFKCFI